MCLRFLLLVSIVYLALSTPLVVTAQLSRLPQTPEPPLQTSQVNWYSANDRLTEELITAPIGDLARRAVTEPAPRNAADWMRRLALLIRAEYRQDALTMLRSRPRFLDAGHDWRVDALASEELNYRDLETARRVCEQFPEEQYGPSLIDNVLRAYTPAEADAWLAKRASGHARQWVAARLRRRAKDGTEAPLLVPYEKSVRAHPDDLERVADYLWAVRSTEKKQALDWLSAICKPKLAIESLVLGQTLASAGADPIPLFLRALETPFTERDNDWYKDYIRRMKFAYFRPNAGMSETQLRTQTKRVLMAAYQKSGQAAKAQELLEELTAKNKDGLPDVGQAFQAGQVQAASGAHVIQDRIIAAAAQSENRDSAGYWLERAQYFSARKEDKEAVTAFDKALSLAPVPTDNHPSPRLQILIVYDRYLWLRNTNRPMEAMTLLHRELEAVPLDNDYADNIVSEMLWFETDTSHMLDPDDNRLWAFLAAKPDWPRFRQLLQHLVQNTPTERRDPIWTRAEALAKAAPAGRAFTLGETMVYLKEPKRAIPWLQLAAEHSLDKQQRQEALTNLWTAYKEAGDWRAMQKLLPIVTRDGERYYSQTTRELELALAAASSGARLEAMVFFRQWANQDRRPAPNFYPLPTYGLYDDLKVYYHQIEVEEPRCETPRRVRREVGI